VGLARATPLRLLPPKGKNRSELCVADQTSEVRGGLNRWGYGLRWRHLGGGGGKAGLKANQLNLKAFEHKNAIQVLKNLFRRRLITSVFLRRRKAQQDPFKSGRDEAAGSLSV
jgi:hypothetical protein